MSPVHHIIHNLDTIVSLTESIHKPMYSDQQIDAIDPN